MTQALLEPPTTQRDHLLPAGPEFRSLSPEENETLKDIALAESYNDFTTSLDAGDTESAYLSAASIMKINSEGIKDETIDSLLTNEDLMSAAAEVAYKSTKGRAAEKARAKLNKVVDKLTKDGLDTNAVLTAATLLKARADSGIASTTGEQSSDRWHNRTFTRKALRNATIGAAATAATLATGGGFLVAAGALVGGRAATTVINKREAVLAGRAKLANSSADTTLAALKAIGNGGVDTLAEVDQARALSTITVTRMKVRNTIKALKAFTSADTNDVTDRKGLGGLAARTKFRAARGLNELGEQVDVTAIEQFKHLKNMKMLSWAATVAGVVVGGHRIASKLDAMSSLHDSMSIGQQSPNAPKGTVNGPLFFHKPGADIADAAQNKPSTDQDLEGVSSTYKANLDKSSGSTSQPNGANSADATGRRINSAQLTMDKITQPIEPPKIGTDELYHGINKEQFEWLLDERVVDSGIDKQAVLDNVFDADGKLKPGINQEQLDYFASAFQDKEHLKAFGSYLEYSQKTIDYSADLSPKINYLENVSIKQDPEKIGWATVDGLGPDLRLDMQIFISDPENYKSGISPYTSDQINELLVQIRSLDKGDEVRTNFETILKNSGVETAEGKRLFAKNGTNVGETIRAFRESQLALYVRAMEEHGGVYDLGDRAQAHQDFVNSIRSQIADKAGETVTIKGGGSVVVQELENGGAEWVEVKGANIEHVLRSFGVDQPEAERGLANLLATDTGRARLEATGLVVEKTPGLNYDGWDVHAGDKKVNIASLADAIYGADNHAEAGKIPYLEIANTAVVEEAKPSVVHVPTAEDYKMTGDVKHNHGIAHGIIYDNIPDQSIGSITEGRVLSNYEEAALRRLWLDQVGLTPDEGSMADQLNRLERLKTAIEFGPDNERLAQFGHEAALLNDVFNPENGEGLRKALQYLDEHYQGQVTPLGDDKAGGFTVGDKTYWQDEDIRRYWDRDMWNVRIKGDVRPEELIERLGRDLNGSNPVEVFSQLDAKAVGVAFEDILAQPGGKETLQGFGLNVIDRGAGTNDPSLYLGRYDVQTVDGDRLRLEALMRYVGGRHLQIKYSDLFESPEQTFGKTADKVSKFTGSTGRTPSVAGARQVGPMFVDGPTVGGSDGAMPPQLIDTNPTVLSAPSSEVYIPDSQSPEEFLSTTLGVDQAQVEQTLGAILRSPNGVTELEAMGFDITKGGGYGGMDVHSSGQSIDIDSFKESMSRVKDGVYSDPVIITPVDEQLISEINKPIQVSNADGSIGSYTVDTEGYIDTDGGVYPESIFRHFGYSDIEERLGRLMQSGGARQSLQEAGFNIESIEGGYAGYDIKMGESPNLAAALEVLGVQEELEKSAISQGYTLSPDELDAYFDFVTRLRDDAEFQKAFEGWVAAEQASLLE